LLTTFDAFIAEGNRIREKYSEAEMKILIGVETEHIHQDDLELLKQVIDKHRTAGRLDFVVGSVHHVDGHPIDFSKEKFERALVAFEARAKAARQESGGKEEWTGDDLQHNALSIFLKSYFQAQRRMMETLKPEVIGHFSLPLLFTPSTLISSHPDAHALAIENVRYAISYGALFELSSAPFRKGLEYGWPGDEVVKMVQKEGGLWCLSDDAHSVGQVGLNYRRLRDWARGLGIDEAHVRALGKGEDGNLTKQLCESVWRGSFWDQ
jgi:histidinol-phosphatase (PHP family)